MKNMYGCARVVRRYLCEGCRRNVSAMMVLLVCVKLSRRVLMRGGMVALCMACALLRV
jgi:hypothetical protein